MGGQQRALATLYPRERVSTHLTRGWVGTRAGLDGRKISPPLGYDPGLSYPAHSEYNYGLQLYMNATIWHPNAANFGVLVLLGS